MNFHQLKQNQEIQNVLNSIKHSKQLHNDMFLNKRMLVGGGLNDYQDYVQQILKRRAEELNAMSQPMQPDYTPADMENSYSSKTTETSRNIDTILMKIVDGLSQGVISDDMIISIYSCVSTLSTKGFLLSKAELESDLIIIQSASNKIQFHLENSLLDPKQFKIFNLAIKVLQRIYFILDALIKNYVDNEKERKLILQTILKQIKLKQFDTGELTEIRPSPAFVQEIITIAQDNGVNVRAPDPIAGLETATGIPFSAGAGSGDGDSVYSGVSDSDEDSDFEDAPKLNTVEDINKAIDILTEKLTNANDRADLLPSESINFEEDYDEAEKEIADLVHQLDHYEKLKSRLTGTPVPGTPWSIQHTPFSEKSQTQRTLTFDDLPALEHDDAEAENEDIYDHESFEDAYSSKPINPEDATALTHDEEVNEGDEFTSSSTAPQTESKSTLEKKAESNLHNTEGLNDLFDVLQEIHKQAEKNDEPESLNDRSIEHTVAPAIDEHEALHQQLEGVPQGIQEAREEHDQVAEAVEQGVVKQGAEEMAPVIVDAEVVPVEGPVEPEVEEVAQQPIKYATHDKLESLENVQLKEIIQKNKDKMTPEQKEEFLERYGQKLGSYKKLSKPKLVDIIIRYNFQYAPIKLDYSKMENDKLQAIVGKFIDEHEFTRKMTTKFKQDYGVAMGSYKKLTKPQLLEFIEEYGVAEEEEDEEEES